MHWHLEYIEHWYHRIYSVSSSQILYLSSFNLCCLSILLNLSNYIDLLLVMNISSCLPLALPNQVISTSFSLRSFAKLHQQVSPYWVNNERSKNCLSKETRCNQTHTHSHSKRLSTIGPHSVESCIEVGNVFPETICRNLLIIVRSLLTP